MPRTVTVAERLPPAAGVTVVVVGAAVVVVGAAVVVVGAAVVVVGAAVVVVGAAVVVVGAAVVVGAGAAATVLVVVPFLAWPGGTAGARLLRTSTPEARAMVAPTSDSDTMEVTSSGTCPVPALRYLVLSAGATTVAPRMRSSATDVARLPRSKVRMFTPSRTQLRPTECIGPRTESLSAGRDWAEGD
jgi:hypothetical protein